MKSVEQIFGDALDDSGDHEKIFVDIYKPPDICSKFISRLVYQTIIGENLDFFNSLGPIVTNLDSIDVYNTLKVIVENDHDGTKLGLLNNILLRYDYKYVLDEALELSLDTYDDYEGDISYKVMKLLTKCDGIDIHMFNDRALLNAVNHNDLDEIRYLLSKGLNPLDADHVFILEDVVSTSIEVLRLLLGSCDTSKIPHEVLDYYKSIPEIIQLFNSYGVY